MKWRLECQHCQRAKCYEYGLCFPCDEDECKYKPFINSATTSTATNEYIYIGNKIKENNENE